jgi:6-phosphogluconolactonase
VSVDVDPTGRFAYVANGGSNNFTDTISVFAVDTSTGGLTIVGATPAGRSSLRSITVDPNGKFVYTTSGGSRTASFEVDGFAADGATGALSPVPGNPFFAGMNPSAVAIEPAGKFAYVTNQAAASVSSFAIDAATGALSSTGGASSGGAPLSAVVHPSGRFAYVAGSGVSVYTIDAATGALTEIPGSPFAAQNSFLSVAIEPTGAFAYVANNGGGVSAFAINGSSGALSEISGSPFGSSVRSITVDVSGKFVYALVDGGIAGFAINPSTGALTEIAGSPLAAPTGSSITTSAIR